METLFESPPPRRVEAAAAHQAWWGVDVSVSAVSVAYVTPERTRGVRTVKFATLEGGARLAHIWAEVGLHVAEVVRDGWPLPGFVFVEQPSGLRPNPSLSYAVGVVQGAMADGLARVSGEWVHVETVPSATWKKAATGYGRHDKPTKKKLGRAPEFLDYGVAQWARSMGYPGSSWDEADALGIAEAARRAVRF